MVQLSSDSVRYVVTILSETSSVVAWCWVDKNFATKLIAIIGIIDVTVNNITEINYLMLNPQNLLPNRLIANDTDSVYILYTLTF